MIKRFLSLIVALSALLTVDAGVHQRRKGTPFELKNLAISAPQEFLPAAKILGSVLEKIGKKAVPLTEKGNIQFLKNAELPPQGFKIQTSAKGICITASNLDGAKFAVSFLARELGYRHYFPPAEWEIIPEKLPEKIVLNVTESPDYLSRSIWPGWGIWGDYRKATNFDEMWKLFNFQGGITIKCGHVYGRFVMHRKKEFTAHPEYYALLKGKRTSA